MIVVWFLTWIMSSLNWQPAVDLWHWFGQNVLLTILMLVFLG
jgi:hypothetical protein